jgi:hypothetical protein
MSRANPVTKLGMMEVSVLAHDYIRRFGGGTSSFTAILHYVKCNRQYGKFQCRDIVQKIILRNIKRRIAAKKTPDLLLRLISWRRIRAYNVFRKVFPEVNPTGGLSFRVVWIRAANSSRLTAHVERGGRFNQRTTSVSVLLHIHPHWHRQLGAICERMGRFFLSVYQQLDDGWWAVELRKGRGYAFRAVRVRLSKQEVLENRIDEILPLPPDSSVLGFSELVVGSRHEVRVG